MSLQTASKIGSFARKYECKYFFEIPILKKMSLTGAERSKSHRKNSKKMQKDMLYIKKKIEFRRGKVERKLLVQKLVQYSDGNAERKSEITQAKLSTTHDVRNIDVEFAYKSPQTLGKAVHKVFPLLPNSPRKRKAVIGKTAKSSGFSVSSKHQQSNGNKGVAKASVNSVEEFYFRHSISCQAPGRRDFVIVRENGKKSKLQKRHLMWSLKETFGLYQRENSYVKISFSKFCSLRPKNVLLQSAMPRQVCLCQYHDNVKMLCECLSKEISSFPGYSGSFVDLFVCDSTKEESMMSKCDTYIHTLYFHSNYQSSSIELIISSRKKNT